ncbi:MAG: hypothetical protein IJL83_03535 [Clostridia bacterium]|nr:hypothetical protein [Clostridia bacterium]
MKKRRRRIRIVLYVALTAAALMFLRARLRPYIASLAEMEGKRLGADAITRGVVRVFAEDKPAYSDVVTVTYADGKAVSLHADAAKQNALRLAVGDAVADELGENPASSVKVSLGSLVGELFAGRGVSMKVILDSVGTVDVDFASEFVSAGINQTLHRITMKVVVSFTILAATYRVDTQSTCAFNLAETVIVGAVPENYTDIGPISEGEYGK